MAREKLRKFAENASRENIVELGKPLFATIKGRWREDYFKNDKPIVLELACGRGEYTVGLAAVYPDKNFIGVDLKGDRLWKGSLAAIEAGLSNAAFLRTQIDHLPEFFEDGEVDEIWLIHPDPRPKKKDARRRLTSPRFLGLYKKILKKDGLFRLKTDNPGLFAYSLEVLQEIPTKDFEKTEDLYNSSLLAEHHGIVTRYERMFTEKGFTVNYLKCRFV